MLFLLAVVFLNHNSSNNVWNLQYLKAEPFAIA